MHTNALFRPFLRPLFRFVFRPLSLARSLCIFRPRILCRVSDLAGGRCICGGAGFGKVGRLLLGRRVELWRRDKK